LSTDRPDKTEAAQSVDRGHFQFESDLLTFAYDKTDQSETKSYGFGLTNLKYGITSSSDIQVIVGFLHSIEYEGSSRRARDGVSDVTVRFKQNLWGNDGGLSSLGLMPFVKIPTARAPFGNEETEFGLLMPFAFQFPANFDLGFTAQFNGVRDSANAGYAYETALSATVGWELLGQVWFFAEIFGAVTTEYASVAEVTLDGGVAWEFVKNWQADVGIYYGLTDAAVDYNPFVKLSAKF
jgi:hypothetical protein